MPRTAGALLDLDYLHRAKNPLGPLLAGKLRWAAADEIGCGYARQCAEGDLRRAGLSEKAIDEREIVLAFDRLNEFPTERGDNGVETHGGKLRPQRLHVGEAGRRRVVQFAAQNEERLAVNDELRGGAAFLKMRCCTWLS